MLVMIGLGVMCVGMAIYAIGLAVEYVKMLFDIKEEDIDVDDVVTDLVNDDNE